MTESASKPVLVTGAAGFIGYHLADRLLSDGKHVIGLDNFNDYYDPALKEARWELLEAKDGFTPARIDLADRRKMEAVFATYGLVVVIINSLVLILLAEIAPSHFTVLGIVPALLGGVVMGASSIALEGLFGLSLPVVPPEQAELRRYVQRQKMRADAWSVATRVDRIRRHSDGSYDDEDEVSPGRPDW